MKTESFEKNVHYLNTIKIIEREDYTEHVHSNDLILRFSGLLESFLITYFESTTHKPRTCEMTMFIFPGENYREPMVRIIYPDFKEFNTLEIRDEIEKKFKLHLVKKSENLEDFKDFRRIQKNFRIIIQRE